MKESLNSEVSIVRAVCPGTLAVSAEVKKATVRIRMESERAVVEVERDGETVYSHELLPGQDYEFTDVVKVRTTKNVEADHVFPLRIGYGADEYRLNRTKNGKLILTK